MPAADDDIETRLVVVERDVAQLRERLAPNSSDAAARVLAAGADHDVSAVRAELRAHTQALNALRETRLEQGRKIDEQGREIRDGFAAMATGMAQITTLLTNLGESRGLR